MASKFIEQNISGAKKVGSALGLGGAYVQDALNNAVEYFTGKEPPPPLVQTMKPIFKRAWGIEDSVPVASPVENPVGNFYAVGGMPTMPGEPPPPVPAPSGIGIAPAIAPSGEITRDDLRKMSDKDFVKFARTNYDDFSGGRKMPGVGFVQMADRKNVPFETPVAKGIGPVTRVIESDAEIANRQMPTLSKHELAAAIELAKIHESRGVSRDQLSMYQQAQLDARARDDKFAQQKNWEGLWMRPTKDPITQEERPPDVDAAIIHSLRFGDEIPEQWQKTIPVVKQKFQNFAREYLARKISSGKEKGKTNAEVIKARGGSLDSPEVQDLITKSFLENPNRR
jgi:hypothetical protein